MFKGRILLFPGLTYLTSRDVYALLEEVRHWEKELEKEGFTHLFYLTSDPSWRVVEKELTGTLIWLPAFSFQKMDEGGTAFRHRGTCEAIIYFIFAKMAVTMPGHKYPDNGNIFIDLGKIL